MCIRDRCVCVRVCVCVCLFVLCVSFLTYSLDLVRLAPPTLLRWEGPYFQLPTVIPLWNVEASESNSHLYLHKISSEHTLNTSVLVLRSFPVKQNKNKNKTKNKKQKKREKKKKKKEKKKSRQKWRFTVRLSDQFCWEPLGNDKHFGMDAHKAKTFYRTNKFS